MPMFHFVFEARQKRTSPEFGKYGGATVSCWVKRDKQRVAESVAREMIVEKYWTVTKIEEASQITRETQLLPGMQYFEQAEIDGAVLVFHTWPVGASDDTNIS